jgi:hypothetical protein
LAASVHEVVAAVVDLLVMLLLLLMLQTVRGVLLLLQVVELATVPFPVSQARLREERRL